MTKEPQDNWRSAIATLEFAERAALTRLLEYWPRPVLSGAAHPPADDPRHKIFSLGCCKLEARGWLRIRQPANGCHYWELTSRALRRVPQLCDGEVRARFIDEVKAMAEPQPTVRLEPARLLAVVSELAAGGGGDVKRLREIRDALLSEAEACGSQEVDELLELAGFDHERDRLFITASAVVNNVPEHRIKAALASCNALSLLAAPSPRIEH